jgi:hypothetical protein
MEESSYTLLLIGLVGLIAGYCVLALIQRWAERRATRRLVDDIVSGRFLTEHPPGDATESDCVVEIKDGEVISTRGGVLVERVSLERLQKVKILSTGDGPMVPDIFWVLEADGREGCLIPWGAKGEEVLLDQFQRWPGFRSDAVTIAAGRTEPGVILCWDRESA